MVDRCSVLAFAGLRHQQLPILLDIGPVLDRLEDRPEVGVEVRQSLILGADVGIEFVNVVEIEAALRAFSEVLIFRERGIQRLQDSSRSEEHTSELQSLMRISYAVFCLNTKNRKERNNNTINSHITITYTITASAYNTTT